MPNISIITLPDNTSYNVKDSTARTEASNARGSYQNLGGRVLYLSDTFIGINNILEELCTGDDKNVKFNSTKFN